MEIVITQSILLDGIFYRNWAVHLDWERYLPPPNEH